MKFRLPGPVLLGSEARLLEHLDMKPREWESMQVIEAPGITYLRFCVEI